MAAPSPTAAICKTMKELETYVESVLCRLGQLIVGQFPVTQRVVVRGGRRAGIYFCVHGPRSVKLTAIYDYAASQVIFYGSDGIRREAISLQLLDDETAMAAA